MELRCQRELYRVLLCWDTDREEADFGYALQMCLRNALDGILPCHGQHIDGKFCLCWDVTAHHSLEQLVGEGHLPVKLLAQIIRSLLKTMETMERYLLPCSYLAIAPAWVFLDAQHEHVRFLCEFGAENSFRDTLQQFGEFVLAHIDHKDPKAMQLGYGLYRLAVEDTFDRKACAELLEMPKEEPSQAMEKDVDIRQPSHMDLAGDGSQLTNEQLLHREILHSFFSDDDAKETKTIVPAGRMLLLCAVAIVLGLMIMEGITYVRTGQHIAWWWMIGAIVLFIVCAGAFSVLEILNACRSTEKMAESKSEHIEKMPKPNSSSCTQETVLLTPALHKQLTCSAYLLCEDQSRIPLIGEQWFIGKKDQADICLEKETVSRMHARIYRKSGMYYLEDLHSRNGTTLAGQSIDSGKPIKLHSGDVIGFADFSCTFMQ